MQVAKGKTSIRVTTRDSMNGSAEAASREVLITTTKPTLISLYWNKFIYFIVRYIKVRSCYHTDTSVQR